MLSGEASKSCIDPKTFDDEAKIAYCVEKRHSERYEEGSKDCEEFRRVWYIAIEAKGTRLPRGSFQAQPQRIKA